VFEDHLCLTRRSKLILASRCYIVHRPQVNECIVLASRNGSIIVFLISSYFIVLRIIHDTTHKYQGNYGSVNTSYKGPQSSQEIPRQTISLLDRGGREVTHCVMDGWSVYPPKTWEYRWPLLYLYTIEEGKPQDILRIDGLCCIRTRYYSTRESFSFWEGGGVVSNSCFRDSPSECGPLTKPFIHVCVQPNNSCKTPVHTFGCLLLMVLVGYTGKLLW
jgi:hypothetical protein